MVNLNECKFGDKLRIRGGRMALFLGECFEFMQEGFVCAIKGEENSFYTMIYRQDGKVFDGAFGNKYDIIGKWEDEIEKPATPPLRNKARYAESDKAHKGCKRSNGGTMVARHQTSKMN